MALFGDYQVIALHLDFYTKTTEGIWDNTKVFDRDMLDTDAVTTHSGHTDERAYLDHIGQYRVLCTMQALYAIDGQ